MNVWLSGSGKDSAASTESAPAETAKPKAAA
jgi:hypothetical protein